MIASPNLLPAVIGPGDEVRIPVAQWVEIAGTQSVCPPIPAHHHLCGESPKVASVVPKAKTNCPTVSMIFACGAPETSANAEVVEAWIVSFLFDARLTSPNCANLQRSSSAR